MVIALGLFMAVGFSCEDSFDQVTGEEIIEVENETDEDEDLEDVIPGERDVKSTPN